MKAKFDKNITWAVLSDVYREGIQARLKHSSEGQECATDSEALGVLVEEVGEVATAINQDLPKEELRKELIQVASVAVRWLAGDLSFSRKP